MHFNLDKIEELVQLRPEDRNTNDLIEACKEIRRLRMENQRMRALINSSSSLLSLYDKFDINNVR